MFKETRKFMNENGIEVEMNVSLRNDGAMMFSVGPNHQLTLTFSPEETKAALFLMTAARNHLAIQKHQPEA